MIDDVLILGAGPAGTAAATALAREGFAVAIADRKAFPRPKPCGEFLSPECAPYLRELGVAERLDELGPRLVRGMQLGGYGQRALGQFRVLARHAPWARHGFGIRREHFDQLLLDRAREAGATWLPRHEFRGLLRDAAGAPCGARLRGPDGALVERRARWLVAADGVHSPVARALGLQRPIRWLDQFALVGHFRGVLPQPTAEVHLLPGGFFAATTVDAGLFSVNLVVPRARLRDRDRRGDWDAFVAAHLAAAPGLAERLTGAERLAPWRGSGPFAHRTSRQVDGRVALVGDAAGYVDPLTGEGIYFALAGARALATALATALHAPEPRHRALPGYLAFRRRELAPRLGASLWLQRLLRHPWLVQGFLRAAARWPALADLVVTLTGDTIHPRDLRSPAFWREFRAAVG